MDADKEEQQPKNLVRPKGSTDSDVHFEMKNGRVVIIPARHVLISKIQLKSLEDRISRQQNEQNAVATANLVLQDLISRQQRELNGFQDQISRQHMELNAVATANQALIDCTATDLVNGMKHVCLHDLGTNSKSRSLNQQEMLLTTAALVARSLHRVGRDSKEINKFLMTRIGLNRKVICSMYAKLNVLQLANNPFSDLQEKLKRKERKDAVRSKSKVFVLRYCHNDSNAHRIDSNNLDRVKIEGEDKHHVIRIWENALTQNEKYRDFLQSIEYQQFKYMYPYFEISKQVFIEQLCPCLRDPSMHSCVDILYSAALEECILAIRGAVKSDPILKDTIETCNCDVHDRPRQASSGVTIDRVVRDHSVHEIIDLTYCQAVADPFMAAGAGSGMVIPKFIRWK